MKQELLFSVTKKDLKIEFFSGKGGGGQHRNKHQNCVRMHHKDSGVLVTGQSNKSRQANINEAFKNLVKHPKFKVWLNRRAYELGGESIDDKVNREMENILVEKKENGIWKTV